MELLGGLHKELPFLEAISQCKEAGSNECAGSLSSGYLFHVRLVPPFLQVPFE